jgi:adenylate cyclase
MQPAETAEPRPKVRLLAVLAADAVGYSRLMSLDDQGTLQALDRARAVFSEQIGVSPVASSTWLAIRYWRYSTNRQRGPNQRWRATTTRDQPGQQQSEGCAAVSIGCTSATSPRGRRERLRRWVNMAARLQALAEPGGIDLRPVRRSVRQGRRELRRRANKREEWPSRCAPLRCILKDQHRRPQPDPARQ